MNTFCANQQEYRIRCKFHCLLDNVVFQHSLIAPSSEVLLGHVSTTHLIVFHFLSLRHTGGRDSLIETNAGQMKVIYLTIEGRRGLPIDASHVVRLQWTPAPPPGTGGSDGIGHVNLCEVQRIKTAKTRPNNYENQTE